MGYTLGLDIGITSVGFAGISGNAIPFSGVHIFDAAENPKDGASLAAPRREKRGLRRIIHRRALRKSTIRKLLREHGFTKVDEAINAPILHNELSVWDLRAEGIERVLTDEEFIRVLFHIGKRRGADYSYNSRGEKKNDTEAQKTRKAAIELEERMLQAGKPTIGAYLATQSKKRNGDGNYENFVTRDLLRSEVRQLFSAQRKLGNSKATKALEDAYAGNGKEQDRRTQAGEGIAFYQRPLQSSEHLIGECTLEPKEKRAPKFAYTSELFVLWSRLNNCRIRVIGGDERELTLDEKRRLHEKAHIQKKLTYAQARKEIGLTNTERFNISYLKTKKGDNTWDAIRKEAEDKPFMELKGYHTLKDALDTGSAHDWQNWIGSDRDKLDEIARILSIYQDDKEITEKLGALGLNTEQINKLGSTNFSKTLDLSLKAIRNILPLVQEGMSYDKACNQCGYDHTAKKLGEGTKLPPFKDIRNPVVNRALAQTRKVVNAIIREYGMPETIIVELARDVGKSYEDRREIEKKQQKNLAYKEEAKKHAEEILGKEPNGEDIVKYRLWKEQDGCCPYSGQYITPEMMRDSAATQIDHILPYSRSWDDSLNNRVLCLTSMNQEKGNLTPFEKWGGNANQWDAIAAFAARLPRAKAERMLMQTLNEEGWKERNLNDTRYITREFTKHLEQNLALGKGKRVQTRNGQLTAHLRGVWGFAQKNRDNDRHHALDAIVVAASSQGMVQSLSNWNKYEARAKKPAEKPHAPLPWPTFRDDALASVDKIFVSRLPDRKITGAAHEETIRSVRKSDGAVIQRVKVAGLKPAMLENLVDKDRNIKLYNTLKARLDAFDGKPDKAFAQPVYMPTNDGSQGPRINSVRIVTNEKSGIPINGGLASNGDMVRVDVFQKGGKFFLVPLYVHHFAAKELPNKAIVAYKDEAEWENMEESDFIFSLYRNDLVKVKTKKEEACGYFIGAHRGTGAINIRAHDGNPDFSKEGVMSGIGVKTALAFEKYSVDYFGNIHRVLKEKRVGLAHGDDSEPSTAIPEQGAVAA